MRPQRWLQPDGGRAPSTLGPRGGCTFARPGSEPAEAINPAAVEAMRELGVDISEEFPKPLADEAVQVADVVITMGCGQRMVGKRRTGGEAGPAADSTVHTSLEPRGCGLRAEDSRARLLTSVGV